LGAAAGRNGSGPPCFLQEADALRKDRDKPKEKDHSAEPPKIPVVHDISGRIPTMADAELNSLLANARRLLASGTAIQKKTAEILVPLIETEVTNRQAAKEEARKARTSSKRKKDTAKSDPTDSSSTAS
jgi:hypothetical protein